MTLVSKPAFPVTLALQFHQVVIKLSVARGILDDTVIASAKKRQLLASQGEGFTKISAARGRKFI
jgi:hypothetical protein